MANTRTIAGLAAALLLAAAAGVAGGGPDLRYPDGTPVPWDLWLAETAPVAVVVWSSWQPRAPEVLANRAALEKACRAKGLKLVFIDVVEPLEEGRKVLAGTGVTWLHDRHGSFLKRCRVVSVPALVILDRKGEVMARLEPTPAAVRGWSGP